MEEIKLKITNSLKHIAEPKTTEHINRFSNNEKQKIAGASKDFESLLTGMMLKSMTSSIGGFFGEDSYGGDYFDSIFTMELASQISKGSKLGLAEQIYQKVTGEKWDDSLIAPDKKFNVEFPLRKKETNGINTENSTPDSATITPSQSSLRRMGKYEPIINKFSENFNVDKNLIRSIILAESAAKPDAVSKASAKGLMQLMDGTAKEMGVKNSFNPAENIYGGTKYFAQLLRQYSGDVRLSLAAYNAGPGNVEKYNGIPPFKETENYVNRVLGYYKYFNG